MWRGTANLSDPVGILAAWSTRPPFGSLQAPVALLVLLLATVAGCGLIGGDGPEEAARAFATAWSGGDDRAAAALTDDPAAATALLTSVRESLAPVGLAVQVGQVRTASDTATASLDLRWDLGQGRIWSYHGETGLRRATGEGPAWRISLGADRRAPAARRPPAAAS